MECPGHPSLPTMILLCLHESHKHSEHLYLKHVNILGFRTVIGHVKRKERKQQAYC